MPLTQAELSRRYRQRHPEKIKQYNTNYYKEKKEDIKKHQKYMYDTKMKEVKKKYWLWKKEKTIFLNILID